MDREAQLAWERRWSRPAAAAAALSIALFVAYTLLAQGAREDRRGVEPAADFLLSLHANPDRFLAASVVQALNYLALGAVLFYLFRVTAYRREQLPGFAVHLTWVAPLLLGAAAIVGVLDRTGIAETFAEDGAVRGRRGQDRAEDLLGDQSPLALALGSAGALGLAFALVLTCLNAIRAGVVSRFLGIIGIIVGVLYVLPFFGGPLIVQIFWLGALAAIFLGLWPGGRGPAWESGRAEPWPTMAEKQRAAMEGAAAPGGEADGGGGEDRPDGGEAGRPRPKKRKRRR